MPDDALPFAKDRTPDYPDTEDRKKLSPKRKAELILSQDGKCAGCGIKPRHGWELDHIQELWETGSNALSNWQAFGSRKDCDCHAIKTGAAAKRRAKQNRLRGKAGQLARRKARGGSSITGRAEIQSRGFDKTKTRGFDGKVRDRV